MGKVEFHHGVPDKIGYACRLLRKAYRSGASVVVTADDATLKTLDKQLWVFEDLEFVPHVLALADKAVPERQWPTPIWLTPDPASAPGERQILVNLGWDIPQPLDRYARLFEVVSTQPDDRQQGRRRWKQYESMGWQIQPHEVKE
ncbi:MAG: DNA polymerase III subunit chi [Aquabacterium sp.]|jgi:DNA polymerase-3 subunit chi|nr:DNA polymerase III subunit chi [Aquabacterium sp.]MBP8190220.1 DNA polymerase III subunit chi [Aquabacterium sp.]MCC7545561.1 DNA polymerase III subunit chi [Aquabacterium sp.]